MTEYMKAKLRVHRKYKATPSAGWIADRRRAAQELLSFLGCVGVGMAAALLLLCLSTGFCNRFF